MITTNIYDLSYNAIHDSIHMAKKILPQNQTTANTSNVAASKSSTFVNTNAANLNLNSTIDTTIPHSTTRNAVVLKTLIDSPFEFYLGGSRAMLKRGAQIVINEDNDYDFYATFSDKIRSFLISNYFTSTLDYYTNDTECIGVFIKDTIKVVLRKDAKFYKKVFDNIPIELYVKHLHRRNPACKAEMITPLFNEMFRIAHERESQNSLNWYSPARRARDSMVEETINLNMDPGISQNVANGLYAN